MPKLTLNVDSEIIAGAKKLAAENNTSVSAMFSRFIQALTKREPKGSTIGKLTSEASGVIDLHSKSYKDELSDALTKKYKL